MSDTRLRYRAVCRALAVCLAVVAGCGGDDGRSDSRPDKTSGGQSGGAVGGVSVPSEADRLHATGVNVVAAAIERDDAMAVAEGVGMLEQAVRLAPKDLAFKTDLADAYLLLDSDIAAAEAISLYEYVLGGKVDDPASDPILARLAQAYAKLDNYAAAIAFAEKRMQLATTAKQALPAAIQVGLFSLLGRQGPRGLAILDAQAKRLGNDASLRLITANLRAGVGDRDKALAEIDAIGAAAKAGSPLAEQARLVRGGLR